jgi:maltose O-acetyltransferase
MLAHACAKLLPARSQRDTRIPAHGAAMRKVARLGRVLREEVTWVRPRIWAMNFVAGLLPVGVGPRLRTLAYRGFGVAVAPSTLIMGPLRFVWYGDIARNVKIGHRCFISRDVVMDATARISIGDGVVLGPEVCFLTATHEIGLPAQRAGAYRSAPITIGDGVWIGARVTILPGVTVGPGAILGASALVTHDVPANVVAAGVPARVVRTIVDGGACLDMTRLS